ncbi:SDR family NAD(P)-dependent oxidoreductase [Sorangium sp. So ce388]|uniref:SDR family NAD(P)-dependent oxidoreductase n=1 Tax=Sorangium sp. So ce388 TaxID=3133309 RepID=UPI003F5C2927
MTTESTTALDRALIAIDRLKKRVDASERRQTEPIAVIGMGCRYAGGADDLDGYWRVLADGIDAVRPVLPDRWDPGPALEDRPATRFAAMLDSVDRFDAAFFGISPREAESLDPQQRLLLEVVWEALEHAGVVTEALRSSSTGVFIGNWSQDYSTKVGAQDPTTLDVYSTTGNMASMEAGRIAYTLDLKGPNALIDTACSSSLVCVHLACQSLRVGESDLAIAGGVTLLLSPDTMLRVANTLALSPDGRCKTFDAAANGTVRGEGCGVVILKRLSDARRDGDRILALLRGSAVNHDGRSTALTAPNVLAQEALIRQALRNARVTPEQISYVEAHGTGTSLGDPIEYEAIKAVLGAPRGDGSSCAIGSVKTNIAHTEAAAGVAGLIKVILALEHEKIPRHLHLRTVNPRIALDGTPFVIPTTEVAWPRGAHPRRAGVSSFGLSGTNAHVVVEEAPAPDEAARDARRATYLVPLSAKSPAAVAEAAGRLAEHLRARPEASLHDLAYSAGARRTHHDHRAAVVGGTPQELAELLSALAAGGGGAGAFASEAAPGRKVVFVFPGQGGQWVGMGRELLEREPVFAEAIGECERALSRHVEWSLSEVLRGEGEKAELTEVDVVQPAIFAMQVGLAALWRSWGVEPKAVVGHSMGEVAAAYVAGALTLEEAAAVVALRSQLVRRASGRGAMAVVELSAEEAWSRLSGYEGRVEVGAVNGPRLVVLSGDKPALEEVFGRLTDEGVFCRWVKVDYASHSPHMEGLRADLLRALASVQGGRAKLPFYSTVTGERTDEVLGASYWERNLRQPVRFWDAALALSRDGHDLLVELNGHPTMVSTLSEGLRDVAPAVLAVGSLRRNEPSEARLLEALAQLFVAGCRVDWKALYPGGRVVSLPGYPWQRQRYWLAHAPKERQRKRRGHPLLGDAHELSTQSGTRIWETSIGLEELPLYRDHRVQEAVVLPASAYVEIALAAAAQVFGDAPVAVEDLQLREALVLDEPACPFQVVAATDSGAALTIASKPAGAWRRHATARLVRAPASPEAAPTPIAAIRARCDAGTPAEPHYRSLSEHGLSYGPAFRGVVQVWRGRGEALGEIALPDAAGSSAAYVVHPALLDACLQVFVAALPAAEIKGPMVPVALKSVQRSGAVGNKVWSHARVTASEGLEGDIRLLDEAGHVLLEVKGFQVRRLEEIAQPEPEGLLTVAWRPSALERGARDARDAEKSDGARRWLLLADEGGTAEALGATLKAGGAAVTLVRAASPDASADGLARLVRERDVNGVVHLWSLDQPAASEASAAALEQAQSRDVGGALHAVQAALKSGQRDLPRIWLVTRGAQAVKDGEDVSPGAALLWGFARTVSTEHPALGCTRVDLDAGAARGDAAAIDALSAELRADVREEEIAHRAGERFVARLSPAAMPPVGRAAVPVGDRSYRLELERPGLFEGMVFRAVDARPPGPGEVQIDVEAAGLNFRDVLLVLGAIPVPDGEALPLAMGGECAGRVAAVGEGVSGLAVGQEVVALVEGSFGSRVTAPAALTVPRPRGLDAPSAATLAVAHLTAYYALAHVARLAPGERVLIHAATGGVGHAAIQWARHVGAEIFATAGSPEKAAHLRAMGIEHVSDSRSARFVEDVLAWTNGEGVDVVLNSLAGELLTKGFALLRDHGRFIELGKRDQLADAPLGMRPFLRNLTFSLVDASSMARKRPAQVRALLDEIAAWVERGVLGPIPFTALPMSRAREAFQTMAQGRHIGKVVLAASDPEIHVEQRASALRADATYLVTGGLGGLGLSLAEWMVARGARHLVLVGRSGVTTEAQRAAVARIEAAGARVEVAPVDVAARPQLERLFEDIAARFPPLRGVVHAAVVLDDGLVESQSRERFARVMGPKVLGAWNLHELTRELPLDFFVFYSSAAALLGTPGQAGYAAANTFLDALAHHRRALGLPALSINWGAFADVGIASAERARAHLEARGLRAMSSDEGHTLFGRLIETAAAQVGVVPLDVRQWIEFYPHRAVSPFWSELVGRGSRPLPRPSDGILGSFLGAAKAERPALVEQFVRGELGKVLRVHPASIRKQAPFQDLGLDSLTGVEFRNRLERGIGRTLPSTLVWAYPDLARLTDHLVQILAPSEERDATGDEGALGQLSDEELASLAEHLLS